MRKGINREITQLEPENGFLVINGVKQEFDFPIHFHPEYELNFIVNGKGIKRLVGNSEEELDNIELVLLGPQLLHGWETYNCKSKNIIETTIQFNNTIFDEKLLSLKMFEPIKDMLVQSKNGILFSKKTALNLKKRIQSLSKIDNIDSFIILLGILQELANSKKQRLLSTSISYNNEYKHSKKLKMVYDFVQENFHRKISLAEVSELVEMSPVTFNRFIKKRFCKTFIDYVNHTRLNRAANMLVETDLNVSEISFKCGFNNIANFNRVFKRFKNSTPTAFREKFEGVSKDL
ncbi:AraC family transcriptional regulator [Lutibacter flavus]|uniref:AraC-type DNA-binding protein n=1 Tax=Lutibacter flavus TaxID=691689 RepID=A0A238V9R4_9FLAO|nr:AraC family transcriptional regulator [Lutibacter flavus]SNR31172.1 AraC-type DNA-binding protein [Lutibacter flavus]